MKSPTIHPIPVAPRRSPWRRGMALAMSSLLVSGLALVAGAVPAQASAVNGVSWSVQSDGTAPFNADNAPGNDSGANNGVVRAQDTVVWTQTINGGAEGAVEIVNTLPAGMRWTDASALGSVCDAPGGGSISSDRTTLTCNVTVANATKTLTMSAVVGAVGNGTEIVPTATVNGAAYTATTPVMVSATPKTEISLWRLGNTAAATFNGQTGVLTPIFIGLSATKDADNPRFYGYEALGNSFSFIVDVPAGAVVADEYLTTSATPRPSRATLSTSQAGPGQPVTVTVTGADTSFVDASPYNGFPSSLISMLQVKLGLFTPYEGNIEVGVPVLLGGQVHSFDPESLSGQSNFGTGVAPGQEDTMVCEGPYDSVQQLACYGGMFERIADAVIISGTGATINGALSAPIYGDGHGYTQKMEKVLPGQSFTALHSLHNDLTAEGTAHNVYGSMAWDNTELALTGAPQVKIRTLTGADLFITAAQVKASTAVPGADYVLEYTNHAFADDAERKSLKSFENDAVAWGTDPATAFAGGWADVTSFRVKYTGELAPGQLLGFAVPFERTLASAGLPTDSPLSWFWQHGADEKPLTLSSYGGASSSSQGGYVQSQEALVRGELEWLAVAGSSYPAGTAERGDTVNLRVTPVLIGSVNGADSVAKDTKITITLPSACMMPVVGALPANAVVTGGSTAADCASATPATLTISMGDLTVPGGPAGPGAYQGHATTLSAFEIPIRVSPNAAIPTEADAVMVVSSASDTSRESYEGMTNIDGAAKSQDRTYFARMKINTATTFKASKTATTVNPGFVGAGETVNYTISWMNASTETYTRAPFVDLLPFEGDDRGTNGLLTAPVELISASASVDAPSDDIAVLIEYSTDPSLDIQAALDQPGNESADSGVTWKALGSEIPAGITAIRFTPQGDLLPGSSGLSSLQMKVPALSLTGEVNNDISMHLTALSGNDTVNSSAAKSPLKSAMVEVSGTVYRDLDFDGAISDGDGRWPEALKKLELVTLDGTVVATTDVAADGTYLFPLVSSAPMVVRVASGEDAGWDQLLPGTFTPAPGERSTVDLLYQEKIAAPKLVDDSLDMVFADPTSIVIDVLKNDTLVLPNAAGSLFDADTLALGTTPGHGTFELVAPAEGAEQSSIRYTQAAQWPEEFAGQSSYTDSFSYFWTNALGVTASATVTVTVHAAPIAADDTATVADRPAIVDVLANDSGDALTLSDSVSVVSGDATVTVQNGKLQVVPTHDWAAEETAHEVVVSYEVSDERGATATAEVTVTVQRAPVFTGSTELPLIALDGSTAGFDVALLNPAVVDTATGLAVGSEPKAGSVTIAEDGSIGFNAEGLATGNYSFTIIATDDLGQSTSQSYTVTVQGGPTASGATGFVELGGSLSFQQNGVTSGSFESITASDLSNGASVSLEDGKITFHAGTAPAGDYPFTVTYTDDLGQSVIAEYLVTVLDPFQISGLSSATVPENGTQEFTTSTEQKLSAGTVTTAPKAGTVAVDPKTGTVSFDAAGTTPGESYSFSVEFTDSHGRSQVLDYTVTVQAKPTANGAEQTIPVGGDAVFIEDVETAGNIVKREIVSGPESGKFDLETMTFSALDATPGTYRFVLRYTDDMGQTVDAEYTVTVQSPPTAHDVHITAPFGTDRIAVDVHGAVTGVNLQKLTENSFTLPSQGTVILAGDGALEFLPTDGFSGRVTFQVTVIDDLGQSVVVHITIDVEPLVEMERPGGQDTGEGGDGPSLLATTGARLSVLAIAAILALGGGFGLLFIRRQRRGSI